MAKQQVPRHAEEGGWGWVVVCALFVISSLVFGLLRSLGVFFIEFVNYFDETAQAVSWITSISVSAMQLFSPVATALCNMYGTRPVVMFGGLLSGLGFILASQATTLIHLYLSMGLIVGAGWGFVFTPTVAAVMQYFTLRRSLAMALGFTGVGISSFAFSPLFTLLVDIYAWRGALLILGGLSLNMVACGALIRPIYTPKAMEMTKKASTCSELMARVADYFELPLLLERAFLTFGLAITFFNMGYYVPYVHLVPHSHHCGFSEYQAAFLISTTGVTDIVGRVLSGWLSDLGRLRLVHMLLIWTIMMGVFLMTLPLATLGGYPGLLTMSLAQGLCSGGMTPLLYAVVPEIVGMEHMLGALGLLHFMESVGGLLGAPLSGWLRDTTGSYTASFFGAGGCFFMGSAVMTVLPGFFSCSNYRKPHKLPKPLRDLEADDMAIENTQETLNDKKIMTISGRSKIPISDSDYFTNEDL